MTGRVIKSLLLGFVGAVLLGVIAICLGGFAGTPGKLVCSAYMLPGIAFWFPFTPIADPIFERLFPAGGASAVMAEALAFIIAFWTLLFGGLYFWRCSRTRAQTI